MIDITKKDIKFDFREKEKRVFEALKVEMVKVVEIITFDLELLTEVGTDISEFAIGVEMYQIGP